MTLPPTREGEPCDEIIRNPRTGDFTECGCKGQTLIEEIEEIEGEPRWLCDGCGVVVEVVLQNRGERDAANEQAREVLNGD